MGGNYETIEIIILAMIAAFIALRLRSVLGKHRPDEPAAPPPENFAPQRGFGNAAHEEGAGQQFGPVSLDAKQLRALPEEKRALVRKIFSSQGQAGLNQFFEGAKRAYEMTLKGFWAGDLKDMEPFMDKEVCENFLTAIREREKNRETVENRLVEILDLSVDDVEIQNSAAEITIRFESEIVAVVRDKDGKVIDGNTSDTVTVTDVWTFARNIKSKDPNWTLVATQAE